MKLIQIDGNIASGKPGLLAMPHGSRHDEHGFLIDEVSQLSSLRESSFSSSGMEGHSALVVLAQCAYVRKSCIR